MEIYTKMKNMEGASRQEWSFYVTLRNLTVILKGSDIW